MHSQKTKTCLGVNVVDVHMKMLGCPTVVTNIRTVKIATDTFENRAARERRKPTTNILRRERGNQPFALNPLNTVPPHHSRQSDLDMPDWRQFTTTQIQKAFDDLFSPLSPDPVTMFGFRPPELRFVMEQRQHHEWFKSHPIRTTVFSNSRKVLVTKRAESLTEFIEHCDKHTSSSPDLSKTSWMACDCRLVKVRVAAVQAVLDHLPTAPLDAFSLDHQEASEAKTATLKLFQVLQAACLRRQSNESLPEDEWLLENFTCESEFRETPTVWMNPVKPTQPQRFLIHLLLSCGSFVDECDLFSTGSLRASFVRAKLLDETDIEGSITRLMRRYFLEQLKHMPVGTPSFDACCVAAHNTISDFFKTGTMYNDDVPSVLHCRLKRKTTEKQRDYSQNKTKKFIEHTRLRLGEAGITNAPSLDECLSATFNRPAQWDILSLPKPPHQPQASCNEQRRLLQQGQLQLDECCSFKTSCPLSLCVVGAAGVGKTMAALVLVLRARTMGLNVSGTAHVSERAQELGATHWCEDLCVPCANLKEMSPGQLAERMMAGLYHSPEKFECQRTLDVAFIDEMGPIAAEFWAARDIALRHIRNSTRPNGGCLDIVTFDHLQTHPVQGTHPLLSPFLTTTFKFFQLRESVRAAASEAWMRMQATTRMDPETLANDSDIEAEFVELPTSNVSFVETEDEVPRDALFVYGMNAPTRKLQQTLYENLRGQPNVFVSESEDLERCFGGRYVEACSKSKKHLNRKVREQNEVFFCPHARCRITFNKPGCHSNGQLAYLPGMPQASKIAKKQPVDLLVAPAGCTHTPGVDDTAQSLEAIGWTWKKTGLAPDRSKVCDGRRLIRTKQCGLQLYVGSTWHSTMGKTLAKVATRVEDDATSIYRLWDPTQVVIMTSRTKLPHQTYCVTKDRKKTALAVFKVLKRQSAFRKYPSKLLDRLCMGGSPTHETTIDVSESICRPVDNILPSDVTGHAYLLVSTVQVDHTCIGSCACITKRLQQHNSGHGANQTAPTSLRPWGLIGYVCGFQGAAHHYKSFENEWIARANNMRRDASMDATVESIINLVHSLMQEYNSCEESPRLCLKYVDCGTVAKLRWFNEKHPDDVPVQGFQSKEESGGPTDEIDSNSSCSDDSLFGHSDSSFCDERGFDLPDSDSGTDSSTEDDDSSCSSTDIDGSSDTETEP